MSRMTMRGPHGGPPGARGMYAGGPTGIKPGTIKRLLSYLSQYRVKMIFVFICIIVSTLAGVGSSLFMQTLIDGYILPMIGSGSTDFSGLLAAILRVA